MTTVINMGWGSEPGRRKPVDRVGSWRITTLHVAFEERLARDPGERLSIV
jgi:hypothetical protein